jgi:hypothetical protein
MLAIVPARKLRCRVLVIVLNFKQFAVSCKSKSAIASNISLGFKQLARGLHAAFFLISCAPGCGRASLAAATAVRISLDARD